MGTSPFLPISVSSKSPQRLRAHCRYKGWLAHKSAFLISDRKHNNNYYSHRDIRYHNTIHKMYKTDEKVQESKSEIITRIKKEYNWTNVGKWNSNGDIPGPVYNMNKEKDINRQRPVRPSFKNPAGKALKIAGKVVNYWIKKAKIKTQNWHIQDTLKLHDHIRKEKKRIGIYGIHTCRDLHLSFKLMFVRP